MSHPAITAGHTAVITGAASGIGLAAARTLAARGMSIAMIDLPGPKLAAAATALPGARAFALDVSDREAVTAVAATIASKVGPLAANHFATVVADEGWDERLREVGRRCLWDGAQPIRIVEVDGG